MEQGSFEERLSSLRSDLSEVVKLFPQPDPPPARPQRKTTQRSKREPPNKPKSFTITLEQAERIWKIREQLDLLALSWAEASQTNTNGTQTTRKTTAPTIETTENDGAPSAEDTQAIGNDAAPTIDGTQAIGDGYDTSLGTANSMEGVENAQTSETIAQATENTLDASLATQHSMDAETTADEAQASEDICTEGIENSQPSEAMDIEAQAMESSQGASLATPRMDENAETTAGEIQGVESSQGASPATPRSMDENVRTTDDETQAKEATTLDPQSSGATINERIASSLSSPPLTPRVTNTQPNQQDAEKDTEDIPANASGPFVLTPEDIGAKFVPKIAEVIKPHDGFCFAFNCTSILNSPAFKEAVALTPSISNPDHTNIRYKPIDGESGCAKLEVSTESGFQWPKFDDKAQRPSDEEAMAIIEKAISEPRENTITYIGGVPDHSGLGILDSGEQLSALKELKVANQEYCHIGEPYSATALHHEDADFWSVNLILAGYKGWVVVEPQEREKLDALVKEISPSDASDCDQSVRHQNILIAPSKLREKGIKFNIYVDGPGTARVLTDCCYHECINLTFCRSVSTNLLPPDRKLFTQKLKVCSMCGLFNLHHKYGFQVISRGSRGQKRKRSRRDTATSSTVKSRRLLGIECSEIGNIIMERGPCILPLSVDGTTPETYKLAAAIGSRQAVLQFVRLVDAWRKFQEPRTIPQVEDDGSTHLESVLACITEGERDGDLGMYRSRVHHLQLHSSQTRLCPEQVDVICTKLGWGRKQYNNLRDKAKRWWNICSPSTNRSSLGQDELSGLSPFVPLRTIEEDDLVPPPSSYTRANVTTLKDMHKILPSAELKARLAAGRVLENAIATGANDFKFAFEDESEIIDWKTITENEVDTLLQVVQDCEKKMGYVYI